MSGLSRRPQSQVMFVGDLGSSMSVAVTRVVGVDLGIAAEALYDVTDNKVAILQGSSSTPVRAPRSLVGALGLVGAHLDLSLVRLRASVGSGYFDAQEQIGPAGSRARLARADAVLAPAARTSFLARWQSLVMPDFGGTRLRVVSVMLGVSMH